MGRRWAQDILPVEVWNLVVQAVDSDAQTATLLSLAIVCRAFNHLAITNYLLRVGVPIDSLAAGDIEIHVSHLIALHASLYTPPIRRLACFGLSSDLQLLREVALIRTIIASSSELREVSLAFSRDLVWDRPTDPRLSSLHKARLEAVYRVMHDVSIRSAGPVVVLNQESLFRCEANDILHWQLHEGQTPSGVSKLRTLFRGNTRVQGFGHVILRDDLSQPIKLKLIPSLLSISVCAISSKSRPFRSSTLLVVNPETTLRLHLGRAESGLSVHSLADHELSAILPHIVLPTLRLLHIDTTTIDRAALAKFLQAHPNLQFLFHDPPDTKLPPSPLLYLPMQHPGFLSFSATEPIYLIPMLDALGASPNLRSLSFIYTRGAPDSISAIQLTATLRRIAARRSDIALVLELGAVTNRALSTDEQVVARSLACVRHIDVDCASVAAGRAILPWLDLLPALERVTFRSERGIFQAGGRRRDPHSETMKFLEDAMAGLPNVAEVVLRENMADSSAPVGQM